MGIILGKNASRFIVTKDMIVIDEWYPITCKVFGRICRIHHIIDDEHELSLITNDQNDHINIEELF